MGPARVSGLARLLYQGATLGRTSGRFRGHVPGHAAFWGDICRERIRYCRNFVFAALDTLRACPCMPSHDPQRPYVRARFATSEGADCRAFLKTLTEEALERLEAAGAPAFSLPTSDRALSRMGLCTRVSPRECAASPRAPAGLSRPARFWPSSSSSVDLEPCRRRRAGVFSGAGWVRNDCGGPPE